MRRSESAATNLARPARLGDFAEAVENLAFATRYRVEQIKPAAFRKHKVPRIPAPDRIFPSGNNARATAV